MQDVTCFNLSHGTYPRRVRICPIESRTRRQSVAFFSNAEECVAGTWWVRGGPLVQIDRLEHTLRMTLRPNVRRPNWPSLGFLLLASACLLQVSTGDEYEIWNPERPANMPQIAHLEVMCGKTYMRVHLSFNKPFQGLVFSKGQYGNPNCIYIHANTGLTDYTFDIDYQLCGTKPDLHGKFYENTIVVQYDSDLIEVWDEAKRLRCEWFSDYEKTASKPPMIISDLEVVELNFQGDNVDCWMEIQEGKGPWAKPVKNIVSLGSTMTMVIGINDHSGEFDMRVKSCQASGPKGPLIQISDEIGCTLRPKMFSRFRKLRTNDGRSTVVTYAFFHAFKFPDAMVVHMRCKVEICRHGCPEQCQDGVAHSGDFSGNFIDHTEQGYLGQ
ncbi:unnamed protein product, partial [Cyprideis torosa]